MNSLRPDPRGVWKPKPLSALRRPSSLLESANPTTPPDRTTPQSNEKPLHQIPITYSTIAARALSFHNQVLTGVSPVQLDQNGLYCKPLPGFEGTACCFACGSTRPLATLQRNPIEEMQQIYLADCIWQIICRDLKPFLGTPDNVTHSSPPSLSPSRALPRTALASILPEEPSTTNVESPAEQPSTILKPRPQQPQPTCSSESSQSPQPPQPPQFPPPLYSTSTATSTKNQRPTYASVLQRPTPSLPRPIPRTYHTAPSPNRTLTIEDLYRRFHNKPSPFKLDKKSSKRSANRARNKAASAAMSLTKVLISALPAFSQLLGEMQSTADNCWPPYLGTHYSRAIRAA
ncbi:hypothetical protein N7510_010499 [Penicillium lagena]|uniref:uncharacterized protein n=1 Tax=Penicillium lagena TaxID=94218 RepID=UPI00253FE285|nr:uncharacterized protein N7510_010499 [Penicillium lagena]KAJ5605345.1 hypothetical protein N7510_010499 [Penicillium lagena]